MHSEDKVIAASIAIRNIIDSQDKSDFVVCGICIVEFCTAFSMSDEEICQAMEIASGNSREGDDFLDEMISRIKAQQQARGEIHEQATYQDCLHAQR